MARKAFRTFSNYGYVAFVKNSSFALIGYDAIISDAKGSIERIFEKLRHQKNLQVHDKDRETCQKNVSCSQNDVERLYRKKA